MAIWAPNQLTVPAVTIAAVAWVARKFIEQSFTDGAERFRSQVQTAHATEIEQLRSDLALAAFEYQTRFSRLHDRHMEVLAEVYSRLVVAQWAFQSLTSLSQPLGQDLDEESRIAAMRGNEFVEFFEANRIWPPADICASIANFNAEMLGASVNFRMQDRHALGIDHWAAASATMSVEVPILRAMIEAQARDLIDPPLVMSGLRSEPPPT